jgi:hypothetical protein
MNDWPDSTLLPKIASLMPRFQTAHEYGDLKIPPPAARPHSSTAFHHITEHNVQVVKGRHVFHHPSSTSSSLQTRHLDLKLIMSFQKPEKDFGEGPVRFLLPTHLEYHSHFIPLVQSKHSPQLKSPAGDLRIPH